MSEEFKAPDPGEGVHELEIVELNVSEGDKVSEGDVLMAVESDKATVDVPASFTGTVESIEVAVGDVVDVGSVLLTYSKSTDSEDDSSDRKKGSSQASRNEADDEGDDDDGERDDGGAKPEGADEKEVEASPSTRRLARELSVDITDIAGTGPGGRVLGRDVRNAARRRHGDRSDTTLPDFSRWGEVTREPLRGIRRATARHMARSWAEIPHVTHTQIADVTRLEAFRLEHVDELGAKLTLTVLVIKALSAALRRFPRFNASLDAASDEIVLKHYCHIGIAVATDDGLVVPVIRDVDRKSLGDLAEELESLSKRARKRQLDADDLKGGCMTVTNIGGIGGDHFTPIINHPEAAILGVGALREKPAVARDDAGEARIEPRLRVPLILAFDHRLNDGMHAAEFVNAIAESLADPQSLLLTS